MKHNKRGLTEHVELVYEEEMHDLADAITEGVQKDATLNDPFDEYIEVMRSKFHNNPHIFRSRLAKGYSVLLHALQESENSEENHPHNYG